MQRQGFRHPPAAAWRACRVRSRVLKAMANPHRLQILCVLGEGELSVGAQRAHPPFAVRAVPASRGAARGRPGRNRRESQTIYYRVLPGPALDVIRCCMAISAAPPGPDEVNIANGVPMTTQTLTPPSASHHRPVGVPHRRHFVLALGAVAAAQHPLAVVHGVRRRQHAAGFIHRLLPDGDDPGETRGQIRSGFLRPARG